MADDRIAFRAHGVQADDADWRDGGRTRDMATVYEAWRETWYVPPVTWVSWSPADREAQARWQEDAGGEHGFGASLGEALTDLLRREYAADRREHEPPACRMAIREEEG